jgi:hemolysin activation/secretion protein
MASCKARGYYWPIAPILLTICAYQGIAIAQPIPPNPITPIPSQPKTPPLPPPPENLLQTPAPAPISPIKAPNVPGTFTFRKFEFVGNTAISTDELVKATLAYVGKPITFGQLLEAEGAIAKLYTDRGYINSGGVIPIGKVQDGIIKIQIVEGELENIKVTGTQRLNPEYIRSRLAIATTKPLNKDRLLEALQLLRLDPLIDSLSADLSTGSRPELGILDVRITEAEPFSAQINLDNGRSPSVGEFRRSIQLNHANLLGFGDGLSVNYTDTNGSDAIDASYTLPINPQNGTLSFAYNKTNSNVIEPPFDRIDITGNSQAYQLTYRQPLFQSTTQEFALGLTASHQESKTTLLGEAFPLSAGADSQGRTQVSALRFFQEYTTRNPTEVFVARSQFSLGVEPFAAPNSNPGIDAPVDSFFAAWRGQAQYVRLLATESLLLVRADVQLADKSLVTLEQFALGGLHSVRGYRQDALLTDNGIFISAEAQLPILRVPEWSGILHLIPFIDFGTTWNSSGKPSPEFPTLLSPGLGLQLKLGDRFTARLDYGIPVVNTSSMGRSLSKDGLYFAIDYKAF